MKCNIDRRGRAFRVLLGAFVIIASFFVPAGIPGRIALLVVGALGVFEGLAGWCALRALGIKTRL